MSSDFNGEDHIANNPLCVYIHTVTQLMAKILSNTGDRVARSNYVAGSVIIMIIAQAFIVSINYRRHFVSLLL